MSFIYKHVSRVEKREAFSPRQWHKHADYENWMMGQHCFGAMCDALAIMMASLEARTDGGHPLLDSGGIAASQRLDV